jgi:DNA polymerase-1
MNKKEERIIIIDGNALIHRSFHAIPPTLRTKDGLLVNAVFGFSSFLLKALTEFKPEYVVLTLDRAGKTFRHKEFSDYKANRVKAPDDLYEQIPLIKDLANALNISIFELDGFEADDLIGTICNKLDDNKDLEKIIITGDLDTLQLINNNTKVYTMSRGLSDSVIYDISKVKERYGLKPEQIIDYKALRGDPSDNIPGVKGIGEKTASQLLIDYKNLDNLYKKIEDEKSDKIKERIKNLLIEYKKYAYLSQSLATIDKNTPIKISLKDLKFPDFDVNEVIELFKDLGFNSLIKRLDSFASNTLKKEQISLFDNNNNSFLKINRKELEDKLNKIKNKEEIFISSIKSEQDENFIYLSSQSLGNIKVNIEENFSSLKTFLENGNNKIIGHNLKRIKINLNKENINLNGIYFDTMIAAYLFEPSKRNYDLNKLAFSEFGFEKEEKLENKEEVEIIKKLYNKYFKKLKEENLDELFFDIEMPIVEILANMEITGIHLDKKPIEKLSKKTEDKLKKLEEEIHSLAKEKFNINSTKQLKEVLFEKLELPTKGIKKTKTGFSTAEDQLEKLIDVHPIASKLLKYREYSKLLNTYLKPLPLIVNSKTKRIHSHFHQTIAATGRLSSSEPNLQNIPNRSEDGTLIRQAFVAKTGWKLLNFDYSQIELRVSAYFSKDKKMTQAFKEDRDIHRTTAASIYNVSEKEVSPKMRQAAKAINFGIIYGQGPHGLSQSTELSYSEAKEFIAKYFETYPDIKKMTDGFIDFAKENLYVETLLGRKRPLPEITSSIPMIEKSAQRMAINTPIQGTAADIIKKAMIDVYSEINDKSDEIKLILQVHDELIFEVKEDYIDKYQNKIKDIMSKAIDIGIPLKIKSSFGDNWSQLE